LKCAHVEQILVSYVSGLEPCVYRSVSWCVDCGALLESISDRHELRKVWRLPKRRANKRRK